MLLNEPTTHPDTWTTMMSVSGAHNFLFGPAPQPTGTTAPDWVEPAIPVTYVPVPALSGLVPAAAAPSQATTFTTALDALGDPVADQAYFRGHMPPDLAMNGRAFAGTKPALGVDGFWNDTVPRQAGDVGGTPFEVTCHGLTLQGSGRVTVTPPPTCRRATPLTVDLGSPGPTDEPGGVGATPVYGHAE